MPLRRWEGARALSRTWQGLHEWRDGGLGKSHAHISVWYDSLTTLNLHCSCWSLFMEKRTAGRGSNRGWQAGRRAGWAGTTTYAQANQYSNIYRCKLMYKRPPQRLRPRLLTIKVIEKYFPSHFLRKRRGKSICSPLQIQRGVDWKEKYRAEAE